MDDWVLAFLLGSGTPMTTLAQFRQNRLNPDLGLGTGVTGDNDVSFGTVDERNQAIKVAFARLWPRMGRLVSEDVTTTGTAKEYTLTTMRDVESIDIVGSDGVVMADKAPNFRFLYNETDPTAPVRSLRISTGLTSATLRVWGYVPYKSEFTSDSDTVDLPADQEWIAAAGARAEVYRRQCNTRANYERFNTLNRDNDVTMGELMGLYATSQREFEDALNSHLRQYITGKRATFAP